MLKLHSIKTVSFGEALLIHANAQAHSIKLKHQAVSAVSFGMTQHWKWAGGANEENCVTQSRHTRKTKSARLVPRGFIYWPQHVQSWRRLVGVGFAD
jgi:hypothetical protein